MGFVFRRSIKIAPGIRLNVSKRGMGVSVGARGGPRVSVNSSGRVTKSIRLAPGLRWQETSTLKSKQHKDKQNQLHQSPAELSEQAEYVNENLSDLGTRNLLLPHSYWSVLFFAIGGFLSATQQAYDKLAFFIFAMAVIFLITYLFNLFTKNK